VTGFHVHAGVDRMPMGVTCAVHRHRSWVPVERHHVWPLGFGGPDTDANRVGICANGHYAVHEYLDRLISSGGRVPSDQARHFGPKVRALALSGWQQAGRPTSQTEGALA
jgi:hypothetical protein